MYGLATLFSLAMLSFISSIVLQVTARAAVALWSSNAINNIIGVSSEGLSTQSLEQGGIGMMLTMLIISVPPMAGNFFSGTLGNFMAYSAFSSGGIGGARPGPQGQPAGSFAPPINNQPNSVAQQNANTGALNNLSLGQPRQSTSSDPGVRSSSQYGNAPSTSPPSNKAL